MTAGYDTLYVPKQTNITTPWTQAVNDLVWKGRNPNFTTTGGTANAQTLTLSTPSLYNSPVAGDSFTFKAGFGNTGAVTLSIIGSATLTAIPIYANGFACTGYEIAAGRTYTVVYDGTHFQLHKDALQEATANILDFGADPLGVADSSTAINSAIAYLQARTRLGSASWRGGTLFIPAGYYKVNAPIVLTAPAEQVHNIWIEGCGPASTVLDFTGSTASTDGITFTASTQGIFFGVKDLAIKAARRDGISINPGAINTSNYHQQFILDNLYITGSLRDGVSLTNCYMGSLTNIWSTSNAGNGFTCNGYSTSLKFDKCWGGGSAAYPNGGNAGWGFAIDGIVYSSFTTCSADFNSQNGFYATNVSNCAFTGCGTESNVKEGWYFSSGGSTTGLPAAVTGVQGVSLNNCFGYYNATGGHGTYAVLVGAVTVASVPIDISVTGCKAYGSSASDIGIVANGASGNCNIAVDGFSGLYWTGAANAAMTTPTVASTAGTIRNFSGPWDYIKVRQITTGQSVTSGTPVAISFNQLDSTNPLSSWNGSTTWTCPATGTYHFDGAVRQVLADGTAIGCYLYNTRTSTIMGYGSIGNSSAVATMAADATISQTLQLVAGATPDTIQFFVIPGATSALDITNNVSIWMTIARVA